MRQTHISWLFFTERFVYKGKKPVDFGFLDLTSLEARRFFCGEEVRLNRRLAPEVYLGVVEVKAYERHIAWHAETAGWSAADGVFPCGVWGGAVY
jgi:aminoglycoside phosphotransferase family enzyme